MREDRAWGRRVQAFRRAERRLREASKAAGVDARREKCSAVVSTFVADRLDLPAGAQTPAEIERELIRRGAAQELATGLRGYLELSESARYSGEVGEAAGPDAVLQARHWLQRIEEATR